MRIGVNSLFLKPSQVGGAEFVLQRKDYLSQVSLVLAFK